jgi:hypothetical protein
MFVMNPDMRTFIDEDVSLKGYIDITTIDQQWRVFYNPRTGHTIDGNALHDRVMAGRAKVMPDPLHLSSD